MLSKYQKPALDKLDIASEIEYLQSELFGDHERTTEQHQQRQAIQDKAAATRGGAADTSDLPLFGQAQTDLFFQ